MKSENNLFYNQSELFKAADAAGVDKIINASLHDFIMKLLIIVFRCRI